MTALFADTFYWIALADTNDSAHRLALTLTTERAASQIDDRRGVDRIPQFFSSAPEPFRRKAAHGVERLLTSSVVRVVPQISPESGQLVCSGFVVDLRQRA